MSQTFIRLIARLDTPPLGMQHKLIEPRRIRRAKVREANKRKAA